MWWILDGGYAIQKKSELKLLALVKPSNAEVNLPMYDLNSINKEH
jgi:hypothetical protein